MKEVIRKFDEQNNKDKEETVLFGREYTGNIRFLGSWIGPRLDCPL